MDNEETEKVTQEPLAINAKVDDVMHNLETSKVGRNIPLEIKEIDSRDLEFVALCAKTLLFIPTVVLTCMNIKEIIIKWYGILMRTVVILDMSFAVAMFFLSMSTAFPIYASFVLLKIICIVIHAIIICFYNPSFLSVVFSMLFVLSHIAVEMMNLFYLKNTVGNYAKEPEKKETAEINV